MVSKTLFSFIARENHEELNENICLATRNLSNVKLVTFAEVNAFDLVSADNMVITEAALQKLEEVLTRE